LGAKPGEEVPDADAKELELFAKSRKHLPAGVFDEAKWKAAAGEKNWAKVVYCLNRGGRFQEFEKAFDGEKLANRYGKLLCIYQEKTAGVIHAGTGKKHPGYATYLPIRDYHGNEPTELRKGYDLQLITNRVIQHTKSRTIANYWLLPIMPENGMLINTVDANRLGLKTGDKVRVSSATNKAGEWDLKNGKKKEIIGQVVVTEGIRPGVTTFALGFGHWATGSMDMVVDGQTVKGDSRRATGVHANAAMWVDPALKNTCMLDPVGGSVSFYDSQVKLERV
jgi:anaerobic selenocysteine-containing dehydrogenase